jgi:hypothetical protein
MNNQKLPIQHDQRHTKPASTDKQRRYVRVPTDQDGLLRLRPYVDFRDKKERHV